MVDPLARFQFVDGRKKSARIGTARLLGTRWTPNAGGIGKGRASEKPVAALKL